MTTFNRRDAIKLGAGLAAGAAFGSSALLSDARAADAWLTANRTARPLMGRAGGALADLRVHGQKGR